VAGRQRPSRAARLTRGPGAHGARQDLASIKDAQLRGTHAADLTVPDVVVAMVGYEGRAA
jgi:hypothetical protein